MRVRVHATQAAALAEVAAIDASRGYPKTERGIDLGPGRHPASITTTSEGPPVALDGGGWGVSAESLERAGLDAKTAIERETVSEKAERQR